MKCLSFASFKKWLFLLFIFFLHGCSSQTSIKAHVNEWLTRPVSELKQAMKRPDSYASKIKWEETTYPLANGNSVYVEPIGEDCSIHWEATPRGTIVRYRASGKGCEEEADNFIGTLTPKAQ
jgi:hypothetical protein